MTSFDENYRFFSLVSLGILVLFLSTTTDVFAYKEEQVRTTNNRIWSIIKTQSKVIEGKVNKSSYSVEKVRTSTPKKEQLHSSTQTKKAKASIIRESRRSYATNSKGRPEDFLEDPNAVKKFCNIQVTTVFCIRHGESQHKYTGNTPKKRPRNKNLSDKNNDKKKQESKIFVKQLIRQSER